MFIPRTNKTYQFPDTYTWLMGVLNVTPDSFSDGGEYTSDLKIKNQVEKMVNEGVDIIDIGGESTRPGHTPTTLEEELDRVIPAVKSVRQVTDCLISVDTWKAKVAQAALAAGADIINDQWAAKREPEIAKICADYNVPLVLMHNREEYTEYKDLMTEMKEDLKDSIDICMKQGMKKDQLILDPGVGFAKTADDNLETIRRLNELRVLGYPILLATSRKGFLGQVVDRPASERDVATAATTVSGIVDRACDMVRVHNVGVNKQAALVAEAIVRSKVQVGEPSNG